VYLTRLTTSPGKLYKPHMSLKASALVIPVIFLIAGWANAQNAPEMRRPLFLNNRPYEDPSVIDITEVDKQYAKAAVQEYDKGVEDARKGDHAGAIAHLQAAIRIEPGFFNAHNSLAILHHRLRQYREAVKEYEEAQRINPRSAAPFMNLGSLHIEEAVTIAREEPSASRGLLNEALKNLNEAARLQPSAPMGQYLVGVVYFLTAFYEEAEAYFKKAVENGGGRLPRAHLALADVYMRIQEWDNVVVQLDAYLEEAPFASNREWIRSVRNDTAKRVELSRQ
jgi:tetratricopeptide (TPR) repeat protein